MPLLGPGPWPLGLSVAAAAGFGLLIGWTAWAEHTLPFAALILPLLWASFGQRSFLVPLAGVGAYMVATLRDLFAGASQFFPQATHAVAAGAGLVLLCLLVAAVWALPRRWCRSPWQIALACLAVMALLLLPPLAVLGPGHPVVVFGFVWEGGGWVALSVFSGALALAAALIYRLRPAFQFMVLAGLVAMAAWYSASPDTEFRGNEVVRAVSTRWTSEPQEDRFTKAGRLVRSVGALGVKWVILPEAALGAWSESLRYVEHLELAQAARLSGVEIWAGIDHRRQDGAWTVDLQVYRPDGTQDRVSARQPMPLSLWRPWASDGYAADWFRPAVVASPLGPAYVSFCYEDGLPGFFLWEIARAGRPHLVVSVANNWFFQRRDTAAGQARHIEGMARLFRLRLVRAVNRPD